MSRARAIGHRPSREQIHTRDFGPLPLLRAPVILDVRRFTHAIGACSLGEGKARSNTTGLAKPLGKGKALGASLTRQEIPDHMNHHYRTVLTTRNPVLSHHGAHTLPAREITDHRLKVVVRIDADLETARIEVRGVLTGANLRALYVIARRTISLMHDMEIIIDLGRARVTDAALEQLRECARLSKLASGVDSTEVPCRLSIVDPAMTHRLKESA